MFVYVVLDVDSVIPSVVTNNTTAQEGREKTWVDEERERENLVIGKRKALKQRSLFHCGDPPNP